MLAPKCYSMDIIDSALKMTAKGVGKDVASKLIHQDYKDRIVLQTELSRTIKRIQSFKHRLYNVEQNKIALNFLENKRAWVSDNESLPYGHYHLNR